MRPGAMNIPPELYYPAPTHAARHDETGLIVGIGLVVAAGGGLLYAWQRGLLGGAGNVSGAVQVALQPQPSTAHTLQSIAADVSFTGSGSIGVQGFIVETNQGNVIGGHWFVSAAAAAAAESAYQSGGAASAASYARNPASRVALLSKVVGQGQATLYAQFQPAAGYTFAAMFVVTPNPPRNALLVADATGTAVSALRAKAGSVFSNAVLLSTN